MLPHRSEYEAASGSVFQDIPYDSGFLLFRVCDFDTILVLSGCGIARV